MRPARRAASKPRPSAHETLQMSLLMLDMVPKVGKITASEIHQRLQALGFNRDLRSIQRQLEALSEQFPIERDCSGRPYGYQWKAGSSGLSIPSLTLQESLLLRLAELHLRALLPPALMSSMGGFFAQARMNLGPAHGAQVERRWLNKVRVVSPNQPLLAPELAPDILSTVSAALYAESWLDVDYVNALGERRQRRVMPLGLVQQGERLVLVVRFEGHDKERNLALNRLMAASNTGLPFDYPDDFSLEAYDQAGRFGIGEGKEIPLKFRIDRLNGLFITESRLSADQQVAALADGRLEITATVRQTERLVWWLRGFGQAVEVLAPVGLARKIAEG